MTTMTLLFWFSLSVSVPGQGKTLNDGVDAVLAFKDKNLLDWPIVTDVQMVLSPLDATLFAAFALFAALFFPPTTEALPILGSARSSRCRCHLVSLRTATATAVAVATVAFSHLGGCLLRRAAISS